jgi:hypothetical protein
MWRLTPAVKRDDADDFGIAEPGACALYAKLGASLSGRRVTRQNRTPEGMAIFFTSDTHFGHGGALGLYRRPFASVAAMNEAIIERWNEIVGLTTKSGISAISRSASGRRWSRRFSPGCTAASTL